MENYFVALPIRLSTQQFEKVLEHFHGERSDLSPTLYGYIEKNKAHVHVEVMCDDDTILTNKDQLAVQDVLGESIKQFIGIEIGPGEQSWTLAKEVAAYFASSFNGIFDANTDRLLESLRLVSQQTTG